MPSSFSASQRAGSSCLSSIHFHRVLGLHAHNPLIHSHHLVHTNGPSSFWASCPHPPPQHRAYAHPPPAQTQRRRLARCEVLPVKSCLISMIASSPHTPSPPRPR